jgi:2-amino-4-hydroxy-6-hydroxymethyldihydropteridine diphosphokinase
MSFPQPSTVLIGLGANLPGPYGNPMASLIAAMAQLEANGVPIVARSAWYESAPVPASDQPWFINAVIAGVALGSPDNILQVLHKIEEAWGRQRGIANAARPLDLDLLDFGGMVVQPSIARHGAAVLPHPRLQERAFVLRPLADIAPNWRHPVLQATPGELLRRLEPVSGLRLARPSAAAQ